MNALTRSMELLERTRQSVEDKERLIREHPEQNSLKSLRKLLAQREEESVKVTAQRRPDPGGLTRLTFTKEE